MIAKLIKDHSKVNNKNILIIKSKKLLQKIYMNYFELAKANINDVNSSKILEIGSGPGLIKSVIPNCITSDLFFNENLDRIENVYQTNFKSGELSDIIMIDVFHHIKHPLIALNELNRVLNKNGKLIMIEPSMGFLPRIIYKLFHKEPNAFNYKISEETDRSKINMEEYFAAQSYPYRIFYKNEINFKKYFKLHYLNLFSDFAYLGSGGFGYNQFYPNTFYKYIKLIDNYLSKFPKIFAARMIVVLEKND